jgi:hypothetical protein
VELAIPPALDEAVLSCLAKNPADRPASAIELSERLTAALADGKWTQDQAQHWWALHRPEAARPVAVSAGGLTLEKVMN